MTKCLFCDVEWDGKEPLCLITRAMGAVLPENHAPMMNQPAETVVECPRFCERELDGSKPPIDPELIARVPGLADVLRAMPVERFWRKVEQA